VRQTGSLLRVVFDRLKDPDAVYLGRTAPLVAGLCDAVLGAALGREPNALFARSGAIVTDAVRARTAVLLLRLRYHLRENAEQFAEEVVLAAFERRDGELAWLEPLDAVLALLERAQPTANLDPGERSRQVAWALEFVQGQREWWGPVLDARVQQLETAHARLRPLLKGAYLTIQPHTPPDILGCYVLIPGGPGGENR